MPRPTALKMLLAVNGIHAADIARELGVSQSAVSQVVRGVRRAQRIEEALARALHQPADELFPPAQHRRPVLHKRSIPAPPRRQVGKRKR